MNTFCPISYNTVDRNTSRISAGIVSLTAILFLLHHSQITLLVIAVIGLDFFIRGFLNSRYSIVFYLSSKLNLFLGNEKKQVNAGPKVFAAQVGFVFFLLLFFSFIFQFSILYYMSLFVFLICAILEFSVGFCVACKLYPFIRKIY